MANVEKSEVETMTQAEREEKSPEALASKNEDAGGGD